MQNHVGFELRRQAETRYCSKCVYPDIAVNLIFDRQGRCSACVLQEQVEGLDDAFWSRRWDKLVELAEEAKGRSTSGYDCVIPVSGGKDSYFQTHTALKLGLRPLLVTYHGNNYLPEGQGNLDRMRDVFGVDHVVFGPSTSVLKALNRAGFISCGDMNWHAHAGIKTYPTQLAVKLRIPLVIWGEITWSVAGMFDLDDYVQFNKRTVFEHDMRGISPEDILDFDDALGDKPLPWLTMPSDEEFRDAGTVGIYLGNFLKWKPNEHTKTMEQKYGFETAREPFERTYRLMSNLDDMHENGAHDYLKFVKFGYGRASDHASKDIREGLMSRGDGIEVVRTMDHVLPSRDLERWFRYTGFSPEEFHKIAEGLRDPRVWWIQDAHWWKSNVWGEPSEYGPVLNRKLMP